MAYKQRRQGERLVAAARAGDRYRDVHVFFGGTGAVGGTALLKLLDLYEEMMTIRAPGDDEVPILVATGVSEREIRAFTNRLYRLVQSRFGERNKPKPVHDGYLTHSGVFIALERFAVQPLPGLADIRRVPPEQRQGKVARFLADIGASIDDPPERVHDALLAAISSAAPFCRFLDEYRARTDAVDADARYRSVVLGIPLPSLVAYHVPALEEVVRHVDGYDADRMTALRDAFEVSVRDDMAAVKSSRADHVLIAHTTAVGGMYDEVDGRRTARLGFAHSAVDLRLEEKLRAANALTELYAGAGLDMLITAAGIGVDEVQVGEPVTIHGQVQAMLHDLPYELFKGAKELYPATARVSVAAGRPVPRPQRARCYPPVTLPFDDPTPGELRFERGADIRPSAVIRSGENGYFSVANADALYRVMRVASASELGLVLAETALMGDDPQCPWFVDHVCDYTETDNSRQVFDFLSQPMFRRAQTNGLDPMSLQDLGDAKHQGELHTLGLLILRHRLRTLDVDAIPPYVDVDRFDGASFLIEHSRPLLFEDLVTWDLDELAADMALLAAAEEPDDLVPLAPFKRVGHRNLFPRRTQARRNVLAAAMAAVWNVPCLGSPLIYDRDGETFVRAGYFAAPLDRLVTDRATVDRTLREMHAELGDDPTSLVDYRDHVVCVRGFVDLRPHAICSWESPTGTLGDRVARARDDDELRAILDGIEPYTRFATCGLVAVMHRLRALHEKLGQAMVELGTLQDFRWHMPRDEQGHLLVMPGVVEAFRHVAEGLEKTTGTDRIAGEWGYRRREVADRRDRVLNGQRDG